MISKQLRRALRTLSYTADAKVDHVYRAERFLSSLSTPLAPLYRLWDRKIERNGREIRVRLYHPSKRERQGQKLLLFFHGGGWVLESVDTYHRVCRTLARMTDSVVASVEYARAPEYCFPEAPEDCYAVARALWYAPESMGVQPKQITLIGDSAGGNLAAAVSLMARDRGEFCVSQQILIYPATHNDHTPRAGFASIVENGTDFLLTSRKVSDYMRLYAGGEPTEVTSPYFAPLLAEDLSRQPRTLVLTAQYDPLRDEGEAYADRLRAAGNQVICHRIPDALHGFFSLSPRFRPVREAYTYITNFLEEETSTVC